MSFEVIFQLATSATASFCCGTSLLVWLLSIKAFSLPRLSRDFLISSQLIIGSAAFLGLIGSIPLVLFELKWTKGLSWPILQQEIGSVFLLLILNEYLSVSTLQSSLTYIICLIIDGNNYYSITFIVFSGAPQCFVFFIYGHQLG